MSSFCSELSGKDGGWDCPSSRISTRSTPPLAGESSARGGQSTNALARAARGAFDDVMVGPIVLQEVQVHGGELAERDPRLRTRLTALRKTSGKITADPQFR
jgi:hypothetical protein